jgi:undecaprenyl diphosphate synthase
MLRRYLRIELDEIDRQNIKFQTIGRTGALADNVRKEIERATERTAQNKGMILTVALNYGGRAENRRRLSRGRETPDGRRCATRRGD